MPLLDPFNKSKLPIPIPREWLYECLELRTKYIPIKELFLVCHNPSGEEGDTVLEIPPHHLWPTFKGGNLRVFFVKQPVKTRILWTRKFNYPKISIPKNPISLRSIN